MTRHKDYIPPTRGAGQGNPIYRAYLAKYDLLRAVYRHRIIQLAMLKLSHARIGLAPEKVQFMDELQQELDMLLRERKGSLECGSLHNSSMFEAQDREASPPPPVWQSQELSAHSLSAELWSDLINPRLEDVISAVRRDLCKAQLPEGFLIRLGSLEHRALKEGFDKKDELGYKELRTLRYVARVLLEEPALLKGLKTEKQMAEKLAAYGEKSISYSNLSSVVRAYFIAPRARVLYSNE